MTSKKYKKQVFDNCCFEIAAGETVAEHELRYPWAKQTLEELYKNPSTYKRDIYRTWHAIFETLDGWAFECRGNCNFVSFVFNFVNPYNGRPMVAYITKAHNRAYYIAE